MAVADLATPTPAPPGHRHDDVGEERGEEDVCVDEHKRLGGGEVHCVVKEGAQRRGRGAGRWDWAGAAVGAPNEKFK